MFVSENTFSVLFLLGLKKDPREIDSIFNFGCLLWFRNRGFQNLLQFYFPFNEPLCDYSFNTI